MFDDDEDPADVIAPTFPPLVEEPDFEACLEAQADILNRACRENDELRAQIEDLEFRLTEAEIARDEFKEELERARGG